MAAAVFPFAWKGLKTYQKARLLSFITPGAGPARLRVPRDAIEDSHRLGRLLRQGLSSKGTQGKLLFLPEHYTDFIFSVLAEEWGLVGARSSVISFFLILILRGLNTAENSKDRFGFLRVARDLGDLLLAYNHKPRDGLGAHACGRACRSPS